MKKQEQIEAITEKMTDAMFELKTAEGERKQRLEMLISGYKVQLEVLGK